MFTDLATGWLALAFVAAGAVVLGCGLRMTGLADRLADRTGLGEALVGGLLLGAATSLSGTIVSITSALDGRASLAFSNSIGGIAAQTAFLGLADLVFRRANLEHAAAELTNIFQGLLLMVLLGLPVLALTLPEWTLLGVHPVSLAILLVYLFGLRASRGVREAPMWTPVHTHDTRADTPEEEPAHVARRSTARLAAEFGLLMLAMGLAGWVIARTAAVGTDRLGLSASLVGALLTAVVTSLPELVTTLAAVRRGALQLAVGGIIGGNTFDTLFLTAADISYREGSLYHAVGMQDYFWVAVGLLMTGTLTGGLILRERVGFARIGSESAIMLALYAGAVALQVALGGG
ncbi:sodium:calcium antiporter [Oceanicella sp. SM1341]|uniref:sodium:calcium antiporter n=1 Tax=Oceanicella sp. SM1341 TaxID=1548889 RepID=UPI001E494227|nr:sodium:calcium antiporter [Oceanicella sp. SM1341]